LASLVLAFFVTLTQRGWADAAVQAVSGARGAPYPNRPHARLPLQEYAPPVPPADSALHANKQCTRRQARRQADA
jgi:hypothetical protein